MYKLGLYEKAMPDSLTLYDKLLLAKEYGYDFVELSIDESDERLSRLDWSHAERLKLVSFMSEHSISFGSLCLSAHRKYPFGAADKRIRERSMDIMHKAIVLSADLGIRIIMLAGYDVYYEDSTSETRLHFLENLGKAAEEAGAYGVTLAFETMETPFMNTVGKAMKYVEEISSPFLQVYPDLGNITNAAFSESGNVISDLFEGRGHIVALHLKETKPGVFRNLMYGEGYVDFISGIKKAWELGVRRFTTEFWYLGSENWKENIRIAERFARDAIEEAVDA